MRPAALLLLALAAGCGPKEGFRGLDYKGRPPRVGLAPAVLLQDVPGAYDEDLFLSGLYVGNIVFSGGFEVIQADGGMQNRSVGIQLEMQDIYRRQVGKMVTGWFADALTHDKVDWIPVDPVPTDVLTPPERTEHRGEYKALGHDNQNLPVFDLVPAPLSAAPPNPTGVGAILVPYLVCYYSHNGGWFQGQTWGTDAGARARVMWALYDAETGAPLAWGDHQATTSTHGLSSPNSSQVQEFLLDVETQLAESIDKHVL